MRTVIQANAPESGGVQGPRAIILALLAGVTPWMGCGAGSEDAGKIPSGTPSVQGSSFDSVRSDAPSTPPDVGLLKKDPGNGKPQGSPVESRASSPTGSTPAVSPIQPEVPIPAPTPPSESSTVRVPEGKPIPVTFATLASYRYVLPLPPREGQKTPVIRGQIPPEIKALDRKKVTIEGYMIPLDFEGGRILRFVLSRSLIGCCFADSVRVNEVMRITTADGKPVDYCELARVTGTLEVGEEFEDGFLTSLYRLTAENVVNVPLK